MAEYIHTWRRRETNKFALEFEVFVFVGRDVHVTEQRALSLLSLYHTHTYTHTNTHTHTHTQTNTHTHTHTHTLLKTPM